MNQPTAGKKPHILLFFTCIETIMLSSRLHTNMFMCFVGKLLSQECAVARHSSTIKWIQINVTSCRIVSTLRVFTGTTLECVHVSRFQGCVVCGRPVNGKQRTCGSNALQPGPRGVLFWTRRALSKLTCRQPFGQRQFVSFISPTTQCKAHLSQQPIC